MVRHFSIHAFPYLPSSRIQLMTKSEALVLTFRSTYALVHACSQLSLSRHIEHIGLTLVKGLVIMVLGP